MPLTLPDLAVKACRWIFAPWPADPDTQAPGAMSRPCMRDCRLTGAQDLLTRTSWVDAGVAYRQIHKGRAFGNTCALWLRAYTQRHLFNLGCFIQRHCGKVLFVGLLLLSLCCVGLKTATIETNVEKLWVEAGGRLDTELEYTRKLLGEGYGTTYELLIQTPKTGQDVLSVDSLLLHHKAVHAATKVTVNMYDITWKFRDLCYAPSFPSFEHPSLDRMLENFLPCLIITPLDCFWEGSKLLGPDYGMYIPGYPEYIKWSNLNPRHLVESLKKFQNVYPMEGILDLFERAGIGSAYQERPCLNPMDKECPITAPNKMSRKVPDIGGELTDGCSGFATKYMHWHEDLILGGVQKNRSGHVVRAEAMQSIVQLMGEKQMYEYYNNHNKVRNLGLDWSVDKAKKTLDAWKRKFTTEMKKLQDPTQPGDIHAFSSTSLMDILQEFSQISTVRVAIGYILMLFYACISLLRWTDAIQSQSGIGIAGVLLVALSVAGGLGFCSVLGIKFNASTTQILPFLALGLGVDDMFLIAYTFAENANRQDIAYMKQTGECLKRTGVSVLLTSLSNTCAFFMAAIIPVPALRAFTLQAAILVIFNLATILLVFPAVVSLDLMRREEKRVDVFCCFTGSLANRVIELQPHSGEHLAEHHRTESPPPPYTCTNNNDPVVHHAVTRMGPDGTHPITVLAAQTPPYRSSSLNSVCPSTASSQQCLAPEEGLTCQDRCGQTQRECCSWSLTWVARDLYGPLLEHTPAKVFTFVGFTALLILGIVGTVRVKDGLDLTDIVPHDTEEFKFLDAQSKYFGFYNMYAVTKEDFEYPKEQQLLYDYHQAFKKVDKIIKKEDGTVPDFWLHLMKTWLLDVQKALDADIQQGSITRDEWNDNATDLGILGYKLMVQTGDVDEPLDKSRISHGRLVDKDGIINPDAFYNYLSAWTSIDALAYASTQADFHPFPREWYHDAHDKQLTVPKSQPLVYAQLSFYLTDMTDTTEITDTIKEVRQICENFEKRGLPNFPSGIPFTFWEQYINLRFYLMLSLVCVLAGILIVLSIALMNPWAAIVVVAVLAMMTVELFGFMGLVGIKLSAVPAVILIISVGIGVEFTVHVCLGFLTSIGNRNRRMKMTLEHMFAPVVHGAVSTLLGVIMLVGAEFDFIVKYFFVVLLMLVILGILNGLVLLPVLLSVLGPTAEVVPIDNGDKISPPTPEPSPPPPPRPVRRPRVYPRVPSDLSLSTITEEPTQYSSHEIIVHPEVVVETTVPGQTTNNVVTSTSNSNAGRNSTSATSSQSTPPPSHVTTTVRATAKVKVEVHTPIPGAVNQEHSYKSKRRKLKELENSERDSDSSGKSS